MNIQNIKFNRIILYKGKEGAATVEVLLKDETMWLTQKTMSELFDVNTQAITKHLANIFSEGELDEKETCSKMEQVQIEGNREVFIFIWSDMYYNILLIKKYLD